MDTDEKTNKGAKKDKRTSIRLKKRKEKKQPLHSLMEGAIKKKKKDNKPAKPTKQRKVLSEKAAAIADKQTERLNKQANRQQRKAKLKGLY